MTTSTLAVCLAIALIGWAFNYTILSNEIDDLNHQNADLRCRLGVKDTIESSLSNNDQDQ